MDIQPDILDAIHQGVPFLSAWLLLLTATQPTAKGAPFYNAWPTLFRPRLTIKWVPHPFPSFGKGWESMMSTPSVSRNHLRHPTRHSRKRVGHPIFSPHPFAKTRKNRGTPTRVWSRKRVGHWNPVTPPVNSRKRVGHPIFSPHPFAKTRKNGAPLPECGHGKESVTRPPSPHPFSKRWKKNGAPELRTTSRGIDVPHPTLSQTMGKDGAP